MFKHEGWTLTEERTDGTAWKKRIKGKDYCVISSRGLELDGKRWLHISMSIWNKSAYVIPSYDDLIMVKKMFIGPNAKAIQVFPEESKHVNIHPYVLHLWCCLDGDPLPDFTRGSGSI